MNTSNPAAVTFLPPTFRRTASIWWACCWRSLLLGIGASMFVGLILAIALNGASETVVRYASMVLGVAAGIPMGIWAFQMVLEKKFREFTIRLVRNVPPQLEMPAPREDSPDR